MKRIATTIEEINRTLYDNPLPIDFDDQVRGLFELHYLIRRPQEQSATCSYCGEVSDFDRDTYKHNTTEKCPHCGKEARIKDVRKNTNFHLWTESKVCRLVGKIDNVFFETLLCIQNNIIDFSEVQSYEPFEHRICDGKEIRNYKLEWGWNDPHLTWKKGRYSGCMKYWTDRVIFKEPLELMIQNSDVKYACIEKASEPGHFDLSWIVMARKYPFVEFLWKSGLKKLYYDFMNDVSGKVVAKRYLKKHRKFLAKYDLDFKTITRVDGWSKGLEVDDVELIYEALYLIGYEFDSRWPLFTEPYSTGDIKKHLKYLIKQKRTQTYYMDYVEMMKKIGTPVDEATRYPKDLETAHDLAVKKFNVIKTEARRQDFEKMRAKYVELAYQSSQFAIVIPPTAADILLEGRTLSHCVGSYVDRVADGRTMILYVRKIDCLGVPFYTLEYKDGAIQQCRGYRNAPMTVEVKEFTEEWLKWTKRKKKKPKVTESRVNA